MTTRVLQALDTLDNHTKSTLERLAKKNHQLTQASMYCFAYGRSNTGLGLHRQFNARKKPKANEEIIRDEQTLLYKRLRKSLAVAASNSHSKSVEAGSSRVIRDPEKHTTNVKPSTGHAMCGVKEGAGIRFWTVPKEPQTLRPYGRSPCRMTWSREVEKVPSLQELTKVNRSKALLGISLGDSGICHWCSRSVHSAVDAPFKSPVPDRRLNTQQPQENIDNISTGSSLFHKKTEKEQWPVPLSYDDLLKRKDVKVLTPRLYKTFPVNTCCIKFMTRHLLHSKANFIYSGMWENLYLYGLEGKNYIYINLTNYSQTNIEKGLTMKSGISYNQITIQNQSK